MAKYCPNCGTEVQENQAFCVRCGTAQGGTHDNYQTNNQSQNNQQVYGQQHQMQQGYYQQEYNNNQQAGNPQGYNVQNYDNQPPMKWFKFVIYFQLFAAALINFCTGILYLTGKIYESQAQTSSDLIYMFYPSLSAIDKIYGIGLIAIAVLAIIVRMKLAKFCQIGPKLYFIYCGVSILLILIYLIGVSSIVGTTNAAGEIGNVIGLGILLALNIVYFKKRGYMFIN